MSDADFKRIVLKMLILIVKNACYRNPESKKIIDEAKELIML